MRKWFPALALVCAASGIGLYFLLRSPRLQADALEPRLAQSAREEKTLTQTGSSAAVQSAPDLAAGTPAHPPTAAAAAISAPPVSNAVAPDASGLPPIKVLENMRSAIRDYGLRFGGNPVGINREITSALNGHNPKQVNFIRPEAGLRLNDNGELVDPWGTPYFFHQLSALQMEVRSAGPDKIMWTDDDLVAR
jgi:hypothetical protein